ncbi:hypothetical protein HDU92_007916 [Lobulomyces angularis]|nr:hypothetical protein HDU92_007916 [Lobulomyces angularis]
MKNDFLTKFFKPPHPVPRQIVGKPPVLPTNPFELSPFGYILLFFVSVLYQKFLTSHTKRLSLIFAVCFFFIEYCFYMVTIENLETGSVDINFNFLTDRRDGHTTLYQFFCNLVEGSFLLILYGYNPAWYYRGNDALFYGLIKLGYWKYWIPMGLLMELGGWKLTFWLARQLPSF